MTLERSFENDLPIIFINQIDFHDIKTEERIDRGAYGIVFSAKWRNMKVAVKMSMQSGMFGKAFTREKHYLSIVCHQNIVKFFGTTYDPKTKIHGLVLEYAECGNLYNLLHVNRPENINCQPIEYKLCHAINWVLQCARGMDFLHKMKPKAIIHRDLKSQNLLLFRNYSQLKICDFGVTRDLSTIMTRDIGSIPYMAPEVLDIKVDHYNQMCDVYSFAILLWEVMSRRKPYENFDNIGPIVIGVVERNLRPPLIKDCPPVLENLMTTCWSRDPNMRFEMGKIVGILEGVFPYCYDDENELFLTMDCSSPESSSSSDVQDECDEECDQTENYIRIEPRSSRTKRFLSKLFGKESPKFFRSQSIDSLVRPEQRSQIRKRCVSQFLDITNEFSCEQTQITPSILAQNYTLSFKEEQIEENEDSWLVCDLQNLDHSLNFDHLQNESHSTKSFFSP